MDRRMKKSKRAFVDCRSEKSFSAEFLFSDISGSREPFCFDLNSPLSLYNYSSLVGDNSFKKGARCLIILH